MSHKAPANIPPELSDLHCYTETDGVITTTMFDLPGYRVVRVLGTVYGLTVRSRNIAASLGMVMKSMAGGELRWFTNMVSISPLALPHSPAPFPPFLLTFLYFHTFTTPIFRPSPLYLTFTLLKTR